MIFILLLFQFIMNNSLTMIVQHSCLRFVSFINQYGQNNYIPFEIHTHFEVYEMR